MVRGGVQRRLASFLFTTALLFAAGCGGDSNGSTSGSPDDTWTTGTLPPPYWPLHGGSGPDAVFSATYGPRLKPGGSYEFHRGVDIPTPVGTDVHAITNGRVKTILTDDIDTQGQRVELCHTAKDGEAPPEDCSGAAFFGFYSHLSTLDVKEGDVVPLGGKLGESGVGPNGFPHLHFEIRDDNGHSEDALHPLTVLPYPDKAAPEVAITKVDSADPTHPVVTVTATVDASELDLTGMHVRILDGGGAVIDERDFDAAAWNEARTLSGGDSEANTSEIDGLRIEPEAYSDPDPTFVIHVTFLTLKGPSSAKDLHVEATARDARGNESTAKSP